jgi:NitT/TauT family transport system ATP-binding protein
VEAVVMLAPLQASPSAAVAKLRLSNISVDYPTPDGKRVRVLDNVSLDVAPGEFVSIIGPSGCGKSTLLRIVSDLVQPSAGTAEIDAIPASQTRERVGFMFQRDTLLPWASVAENIRVGLDLAGVKSDASQARLAELISFLRLTGFERHRPHELSGGMRQRVALGRLLAFEPDIYLMDEPFGALDSQTKAAMGRELLRIWSTYRRSVLFVTHDIDEAVLLSDRVIVLSSRPGRIKLDLAIDLERPREARLLRKNPQFAELVDRVWSALPSDA